MQDDHEQFMQRALALARLAEGDTSPNPGVGAVLVCEGIIIGEGYHAAHGHAHAEVKAVRSVRPEHQSLIAQATLYVTLEPCCVYGRTPPCTDLILETGIKRVVISAIDQSPGVNGKGLKILRSKGVEVITDVLRAQGEYQAQIRNTFITEKRPYVILKLAMSRDGIIGQESGQVNLSNPPSWRLVHRLRHRVDGIMIGTRTALIDDPQLTNRLFWGESPVRIIPDLKGRLHPDLAIFRGPTETWIIRESHTPTPEKWPEHVKLKALHPRTGLDGILHLLAEDGLSSILVEGGATLIQSFWDHDLWDEAILSSTDRYLGQGISAPVGFTEPEDHLTLGTNEFSWFRHSRYKS